MPKPDTGHWVPALLLMLCWLASLGPAAAEAAQTHITTAQVLSIPGHGYSPPPYQVDVQQLPDQWLPVELPHTQPKELVPPTAQYDSAETPTVITWYRLQLPAQATGALSHYLYIPRWKTDGQLAVYGDGRLLYMSHADVYWNGWNIPLRLSLDTTAGTPTPTTILLRIERPADSGGGISSVWLQDSNSPNWRYPIRYLLQVQLPYTSSAAFLAVGLFSFFVWCRLRNERSYLLFFFISVASFLRTLHYHLGENQLPIAEGWFSWLTINSLFWMVLITHFFLNYLHHRPQAWLDNTVNLLTLIVGLFTLPMFSSLLNAYALAPLTYVALIVLGSTVAVAGLYQSWRVRSTDGLLLGSWAVVGMVLGCYDWLLQNNYVNIETIYLGPYSNIGAFVILMYIVFRRYLQANENVRQANASLTSRLREREEELQESHQRLREIEHRQTLSNERQRLMQDMHDGMGSTLLTALLAAEKGRLDTQTLAEVLKTCIDDLKLTIDSMEPVEADLLLLLATLRFRLSPRLESAGISLRWDICNVPALDWLDPRNALHILRILQEAFSNIIKHTQASEIRVATSFDARHVRVVVTDNGQGFDTTLKHQGKGLNNQLRRAASIGAGLEWDSNAGGTCLVLSLPINLGSR